MTTLRFNKPFEVLTQFTDQENRQTLADFINIPDIYPAGRLDRDSEGLLLLTDDGALQNRISHPDHKLKKIYWAQVDGDITEEAIEQLRSGVTLKDGKTKPAQAKIIQEPDILWQRNPPIRVRAAIPTSWVQLKISEGKNRQVRRMTAAVDCPTLRLIRYRVGDWTIEGIANGEWVEHHLKPSQFYRQGAKAGAIRRLATKVNIEELVLVAKADFLGRTTPEAKRGEYPAGEWLLEQAQQLSVRNRPLKPLVQGRDLIALGMKPSPKFKSILDTLYAKQMDGDFESKEAALAYAKEHYL